MMSSRKSGQSSKKMFGDSSKKIGEWFDRVTKVKKKFIYFFNEGSQQDVGLLGIKGADICETTRLGGPVPPGYVITTEICKDYFSPNTEEALKVKQNFEKDSNDAVKELEKQTGKRFDNIGRDVKSNEGPIPLFLAVRTSTVQIMPGMSDTILNIGINDDTVQIMARITKNPRWAYDTYRTFIQMFGTVALGIDKQQYTNIIQTYLRKREVKDESKLPLVDIQAIVEEFKSFTEFPQDPWEQLSRAIQAVYASWASPRFKTYRDVHWIDKNMGIAVIIQTMVYGNMNAYSGAGVVYSRNPNDGTKQFYGEYLPGSETHHIGSGGLTPMDITAFSKEHHLTYDRLVEIVYALEKHFKTMQMVEFTLENNVLYLLQTSTGRRSPEAGVRIAVELVYEGQITEREALLRVDAGNMDYVFKRIIDPANKLSTPSVIKDKEFCSGYGASFGAVTGRLVFNSGQAEEWHGRGEMWCILYAKDASAEDLTALEVADGLFTSTGGFTSDAAVLMRELGKPAAVSCRGLVYDVCNETLTNAKGSVTLRAGDIITVDGSTGILYQGEIHTVVPNQPAYYHTIMDWSEKYHTMVISAAITQSLADGHGMSSEMTLADDFQSEGVGMFCTEHMFTAEGCMKTFMQFILCDTERARMELLAQLQTIHQSHFENVFKHIRGNHVYIRLLDKPLLDFLPIRGSGTFSADTANLAKLLGVSVDSVLAQIERVHSDAEPWLRSAGVKMSILHPEMTIMQVKAISTAAIKSGYAVPHITVAIPNIFNATEVAAIAPLIRGNGHLSMQRGGEVGALNVKVAALLETPRACMSAEHIVTVGADSIIIGTDKLTQCKYGMSRNAARSIMPAYLNKTILAASPFMELDPEERSFIKLAVERARAGNRRAQISVYGEHCGHPQSVAFLHSLGVDSIVVAPERIPTARIAAAQASIRTMVNEGDKIDAGRTKSARYLFSAAEDLSSQKGTGVTPVFHSHREGMYDGWRGDIRF